MITQEQKQRILDAMASNRANYQSDARHAASLGISASVYSELRNGRLEKSLSDANWLRLARRLGVSLSGGTGWKAVRTETFDYVTGQLSYCQQNSYSVILCDVPNIGKTFSARHYAMTHKNVAMVDCSQVKVRGRFVRALAREFGLGDKGLLSDVYEDLVCYLRSSESPLVILDEAGDLTSCAFLELKALWNASEHCCGWYMMGADGLRAKIDSAIKWCKVGYAEIFSRYGGKYSKATPDGDRERASYMRRQLSLVARANAPKGMDVTPLVNKSMEGGGLRRLYTEIRKQAMSSVREVSDVAQQPSEA